MYKGRVFPVLMESLELRRRVDSSYERYGWTEEQKETFERFMEERYANYKRPENTLRSKEHFSTASFKWLRSVASFH